MITPPAVRDRVIDYRKVPVASIDPHPLNPWKHGPEQRSLLRALFDDIGFVGALIVVQRGDRLQLVDGHLRLDELPPDYMVGVLVTDLSDDEIKQLLVAYNGVARMPKPDLERVSTLMASITTQARGSLGELLKLAASLGHKAPQHTTEDTVPTPPASPITQPGDLWMLGNHRLLCGDSTSPEDMARLLQRAPPISLLLTDPPYNIGGNFDCYAKDMRESYAELKAAEWDQTFDIRPFFAAVMPYLSRDLTAYVFTAQPIIQTIWDWMNTWASNVSYCVWCKSNPMPSLAKRHWCWGTELVAYATRGKHHFEYPATGHSLNWWDIPTTQHNRQHPTQKPVAVAAHAIKHSSEQGAHVFDGFAGSGTMLIACQQLHRRCYAMERSPSYCDVTISRWEALTGDKAKLLTRAPLAPGLPSVSAEPAVDGATEGATNRIDSQK